MRSTVHGSGAHCVLPLYRDFVLTVRHGSRESPSPLICYLHRYFLDSIAHSSVNLRLADRSARQAKWSAHHAYWQSDV
jgi:hypothetical protein